MNVYQKGAIAGLAATMSHTAAMVAVRRLSGRSEQPTPPVQITATAARRAGTRAAEGDRRLTAATALTHFGFGALMGVLYAALAGSRPRPPLTGVGFGLGVWAVSYFGWVPALRLLPPATHEPPHRNLMMVLAHVAWGATLRAVFNRLCRVAHLPRS